MADQEKVEELKRKYGPCVEGWLSSNKNNRTDLYNFFLITNKIFNGEKILDGKMYKIDSLAKTLEKFCAHKVKEKQFSSIEKHVLKRQKMAPASTYASSRKKERNLISVEYKENRVNTAAFDPKTEAIKINHLKEKIYLKSYLKFETKDKILEPKSLDTDKTEQQQKKEVPIETDKNKTVLKVIKAKPYSLRKKTTEDKT